jgi:hypothetical protein
MTKHQVDEAKSIDDYDILILLNYVTLDFMKNSHRRIPAAQTAGPIH